MKTISLALTDNKDFRLVNVELPENPDFEHHANWYNNPAITKEIEDYHAEIKRLVDSCPVVSDELTAKSLILGNLFESKDKELIPYKIYSIPGWQAEVKIECSNHSCNGTCLQTGGCDFMVKVAILSKSESEEKEEPKDELYLKSPDDSIDLVVEAPVKVSEKLYTKAEVREHQIKFAKWYSGMEEQKVINAYNRYLTEQGF